MRLRRVGIDTYSEHVVFIHERTVHDGQLGLKPLDRVRVAGRLPGGGPTEINGVLNFCRGTLLAPDEVGVSEVAFADLRLEEGAGVVASLARPPQSVDLVRAKLRGHGLGRGDFDAILQDVVARRYSRPELAMFVLACALQKLDEAELVDLTRAMIGCGSRLRFDAPVVADKHCIGGIPGNRTTLILVPILVALGLTVPKTSSRAITSASGTADTMATLAEVELSAEALHEVVGQVGGCIAWGGALDLAPADDVLITVERPMQIDTEAQMIASILAKKVTAGATHALIDIPVGPSAKVRSKQEAESLAAVFRSVAAHLELTVDVVVTDAHGPIGRGIGPRLEALDVLAVLERKPDAPAALRDKAVFLAARILEGVAAVPEGKGQRAAREALDSGEAARAFERIRQAQGARELPGPARFVAVVDASGAGRIADIDCFEMNRIARIAGSPAHLSAGVRLLCDVGDSVARGQPAFEIHAESEAQLAFAREVAEARPGVLRFGV
jgi:thymidine phosphorylase